MSTLFRNMRLAKWWDEQVDVWFCSCMNCGGIIDRRIIEKAGTPAGDRVGRRRLKTPGVIGNVIQLADFHKGPQDRFRTRHSEGRDPGTASSRFAGSDCRTPGERRWRGRTPSSVRHTTR